MSQTYTVTSELPPGHLSVRHKLGNPFSYFKKCLTLYADGKGRAGIAEYWSFALVSTLTYLVPFALLLPGAMSGEEDALFFAGAGLIGLLWLGLLIPSITVLIRRLHDVGMSGWWLLLFYPLTLIYVGSLILLVISLIPSSASPNKHGPSPKNAQADLSATFA